MSQPPSESSSELHKMSREEPLNCPLWLTLYHLVVVEMINMLLMENNQKNTFKETLSTDDSDFSENKAFSRQFR